MFLLTQPAKLSIYPKNTQCWDRISSHSTRYINIHPENFYDKNLLSGPTYSMFSTYAYVIKQRKVQDEGAFVSFDGYLQSRSTSMHPVTMMMKISMCGCISEEVLCSCSMFSTYTTSKIINISQKYPMLGLYLTPPYTMYQYILGEPLW